MIAAHYNNEEEETKEMDLSDLVNDKLPDFRYQSIKSPEIPSALLTELPESNTVQEFITGMEDSNALAEENIPENQIEVAFEEITPENKPEEVITEIEGNHKLEVEKYYIYRAHTDSLLLIQQLTEKNLFLEKQMLEKNQTIEKQSKNINE